MAAKLRISPAGEPFLFTANLRRMSGGNAAEPGLNSQREEAPLSARSMGYGGAGRARQIEAHVALCSFTCRIVSFVSFFDHRSSSRAGHGISPDGSRRHAQAGTRPLAARFDPVQQADGDEQHHNGEDDGHIAEPGRIRGDEWGRGIEGECDGKAADGDALRQAEPRAPRAGTRAADCRLYQRRRLNGISHFFNAKNLLVALHC